MNMYEESPPDTFFDFETVPEDDPYYSPTPSPPPQIPASYRRSHALSSYNPSDHAIPTPSHDNVFDEATP